MQHIRRRDKENAREIVIDIEIMIPEGTVLLRIEDFKQSRARVAAKIASELIDLVEQDHRIDRSGPFHQLNDLPGQGTDVSSSMAANFRLVVYTAKRQSHEFSAGRV